MAVFQYIFFFTKTGSRLAGFVLWTIVCQLLVRVTVDTQMYQGILNVVKARITCFIEISGVTEPKDGAEAISEQ